MAWRTAGRRRAIRGAAALCARRAHSYCPAAADGVATGAIPRSWCTDCRRRRLPAHRNGERSLACRALADRTRLYRLYPELPLARRRVGRRRAGAVAGRPAGAAVDRAWSVQTYVNAQTPPCFLAQAEDDSVSDPHNTLIMAAACRQHQIPVSLYRYARGGHGFAMGRPGTPTVEWPEHYARWLNGG